MPALEMPFGAEGWNPARLGDLSGRAFVVTGTTTGCGFQCAKLLLSKGAQVVMLNRSAERSAAAVEMLKAGGGDVSSVLMDLADLSSVRKAATQVLDKLEGATLQAVICNAAIAQVASRQLTVDSIESQLGVNHMGHFLLCGLLFEKLAASKGRVVVVGSSGYKLGLKRIKFEDINFDKGYDPNTAYSQSKLAQTMFAYELQRRVQAAGKPVLVGMCHPGASKTELCKQEAGWFTSSVVKMLMATPFFQSAEHGCWPSVALATEDERLLPQTPKMYGPTGGLVSSLEMKGPIGVNALEEHALDQEAAARLWTLSEETVGFKWPLPVSS